MKAATIFSLEGRVVLVTGASSGLGARFAEVAAANGARVVLVGRRVERLLHLKERIESAGGTALVAPADVTDEAAIVHTFEAAEAAFGTVDVLVANAGRSSSGPPSQVTRETLRSTMETNLDAVFWWCQEAARRLTDANRPGSIITISSIAGLLVPGGLSA